MTVAVPILETDRLILRGHTAADLDASLALWSDPDVVRHITGAPLNREDVWARVLRYVGHWALSGYGIWQLRERTTGRFAGEVGLADFQRTIALDSFGGAPEAAWVLAPWSHGQGYATEAMTAVLAWADTAPQIGPRTVCIVAPANTGSLRVAARLGYRELARTEYKARPVIAFERTRER